MPSTNNVQTDFRGGIIGPYAQGRMDDPRYAKGLAEALNVVILEEGSMTRRPGTRFAAATRGGKAGRLLPFIQETDRSYNLELTDDHLRVFRGDNLLTDGSAATVSNISAASPAVLTTSVATAWATGDQVIFAYGDVTAAQACPPLANRVFTVYLLTTATFQLHDAVTGLPLDGSTVGWTAGLNITATKVVDLATPYAGGSWTDLRVVQNQNNAVLIGGGEPIQELTATPGGLSDTFTIAEADLQDGPYIDPVTGSVITPDGLTGLINFTLSFAAYDATVAYSVGDFVTASATGWKSTAVNNLNHTPAVGSAFWTAANPGDAVRPGGFVAGDIGRHLRFFSEPPAWVSATTYSAGNVVKFNNLYWTALTSMAGASPSAGNINPNQPGNLTTTWAVNPTAAIWSWGKVTALSTTGLISGSLAGSVTVSANASNADNAFDGNEFQSVFAVCPALGSNGTGYIGKNYSAASDQVISSVRIFPSEDEGFAYGPFAGHAITCDVTLNLYAKASVPATPTDGTLLGTTTFHTTQASPDLSAKTITSNDNSTAWKYVWVQVSASVTSNNSIWISQIEFYSSAGTPGSGVQVQLLGSPLLYIANVNTWRLGLFNTPDAVWPTCGTYFEGRLWLGGAVKNRFDGSKSNDWFNFAPTGDDGTVADNNSISYTLNSKVKNSISWMQPVSQGIAAGTIGDMWLIHATNLNDPITPTSIQAHALPASAGANIEPAKAFSTLIYVQKYGRKVLELLEDVYSGKYSTPTLTDFAKHLFNTGAAETHYQEELAPLLWVRAGDGSLAAATYRRSVLLSSQQPDFVAWHRHTLGSARSVQSICVGPNMDGTLDALSMVTKDPETGVNYVEILTDLPATNATVFQSVFLDCATVPSSAVSSAGSLTLSGLWHLNGRYVQAWIAGLDCGQFLVNNGQVVVPYGGVQQTLLTERYLIEVGSRGLDFGDLAVQVDLGKTTVPMLVGFTYQSRAQLLRPVSQEKTGSQPGPAFAKYRRNHQIAALMYNSRGVYFGTDFGGKMRPALFTTPGGTALSATELFSGIHRVTVDDDSSFDGQLAWQNQSPYPTTILALGGFIATND